MQIEIYADIVFFINLIMDFFIFWIVGKLVKKKINYVRLMIGSFICSILYCICIFNNTLQRHFNIIIALAILILGILIAFHPKSMRELLKLVIFSHIAAFCVGGAGIALFYFTNISHIISNMVGFGVENFSFKVLIAAICGTYVIVKLTLTLIRNVIIKKQIFYGIKVCFENNSVELNALVDTGNSLHDPITNNPVIIVEFSFLKKFLPQNIVSIFEDNKENDLDYVIKHASEHGIATRIRIIPFTSIGKQNGLLIGFRPDAVEIYDSYQNKNIILKNAIIGIHNNKLTFDGAYNALINPDIFNHT